MRGVVAAAVLALTFSSLPAGAESNEAVAALRTSLEARAPAKWDIHVRWRDGQLLASLILPFKEGFDLLYDPDRFLTAVLDLCPQKDAAVWGFLSPDQDVQIEPTVGGKTTEGMRVSCRAHKPVGT
jgi:hypothetical protein